MKSESSTFSLKGRRWGFRFMAIMLGLLPFVLLEFGLGLSGFGNHDHAVDPFVEFSAVHPLFKNDQTRQKMVIAPNRLNFFAPDEFPIKKAPNTFRIFCLGGSTVQGRPYSTPTAFTTWLRMSLEIAAPDRTWEVINCGGVSYASYRLLPIMQECQNYEPDLFILCTGHNEFLEDRSYNSLKNTPEWVRQPVNHLAQLRTVSVVSNLFDDDRERSVLGADANAILDYKNGLAAYHRDDGWHDAVAKHFDSNIRRMIAMCRETEVPLLLLLPPSNLSGSAPFKSESSHLSPSEKETVQQLKNEAIGLYQNDLERAATIWQEICRLDPLSAINHYELGRCLELLGRTGEAHSAYAQARDLDICPLRMTSPLEQIYIRAASDSETPLINLHELLERSSDRQILGDRWLVDHVHPNFEGHQRIAFEIGRWLQQRDFVNLDSDWELNCQPRFNQHFESLDRTYFHKGQRALQALRLWTQGNADGPPAEQSFPHLIKAE